MTATTTVYLCPRCGTADPDEFPPSAAWGAGTGAYCRPCRAAYMREWRARRPGIYARHKARDAARARALTRLGHRHPLELEELIVEELKR